MATARVCHRLSINFKYSQYFSLRKLSSQAIAKTEIRNSNGEAAKLSTLFVPGRHGADIYQIVKPVIDIDYITNNLGNLKLSCDHRGIALDLDYVLEVAKDWLKLKNNYASVLEKDQNFVSEIHRLSLLAAKKEAEDQQKKRAEFLDVLIAEKHKLYDLEDIFIPLVQKIPHVLHPNTPLQLSVVDVCREPPALESNAKSHTEIAKHHSMLHYFNNPSISYFMSGKLSQLDLAIQMYFSDKFNGLDFLQLSCADFCKSFIIEAIGYDPYSSNDSILLKVKGDREIGQKLHLVGGASFEAFCAYFTNMNLNRSTLPVKYFSLGRRYTASNKNQESLNLFSVVQSTNVHGIILSDSSNVFDALMNVVIECYTELDLPFRIVNIAAKNLTAAESRRKQLELWSPALKDYVPVAYVSEHDDFVSKRLQITYGIQYQKEGYCHIVEAVIVNIPVLIGCIVENLQTKDYNFNVPSVLQKYFDTLFE